MEPVIGNGGWSNHGHLRHVPVPSQRPPQPHGDQCSQGEGVSLEQDSQPCSWQHLLCQPGKTLFPP